MNTDKVFDTISYIVMGFGIIGASIGILLQFIIVIVISIVSLTYFGII